MKRRSVLTGAVALVLLIAIAAMFLASPTGTATDDIAGPWHGTLSFPGIELQFLIRLSRKEDGSIAGTVCLPDQSETEYPITEVGFDGNRLRFAVPAVQGSFNGKLDAERKVLQGRWAKGGRAHDVALERVAEVPTPRRPQTPTPPYPYETTEVTFSNAAAPATFAGTLTLPRGEGTFAAVLLISGGGAQDRDATILRHKPFHVLADCLTRHGIAVLRVDDRGVGGSTGDRTQATSADYAEDALAGVRFLKGHPRIAGEQVGLIGHSEGGIIASLAAATSSDVAFIVMLASPGLPGTEYNLQYEASTGRALGQNEEAIAAKRSLQRRIFATIEREQDPALTEQKLRAMLREADPGLPTPRIDAAVRRFLSPWFVFSIRHDPAQTLQMVRCPVLALFGEKDAQVPPEGNAAAIRKALEQAGNPAFSVEVLPNLNHFLQTCKTGAPTEYGQIEETIAYSALARVREWITEKTGK